MKITDIKTFAVDCFRTNWVFVKVYTDEAVVLNAADQDLGMEAFENPLTDFMRVINTNMV